MCEISEPDDYCQIWNWAQVQARKAHQCDCCGGAILPGSKYLKHTSLYDGMWNREKCCDACNTAMDEFSAAHGDHTWSPSGFNDVLRDCISEEDEESGKWAPMLEAMNARRAEREAAAP